MFYCFKPSIWKIYVRYIVSIIILLQFHSFINLYAFFLAADGGIAYFWKGVPKKGGMIYKGDEWDPPAKLQIYLSLSICISIYLSLYIIYILICYIYNIYIYNSISNHFNLLIDFVFIICTTKITKNTLFKILFPSWLVYFFIYFFIIILHLK